MRTKSTSVTRNEISGKKGLTPIFASGKKGTTPVFAKRALFVASAFSMLFTLGTQSASATVVMATGFNANDCAGFFNPIGQSGFDACQIFWDPNDTTQNSIIEISPVIIKFDEALSNPAINSAYPSVDGSEFSFSNEQFNNGSGTWAYSPTGDDPGIKYWAAKASNDFVLYWSVADAVAGSNLTCDDSTPQGAFTLACLNQALVTTGGDWETPLKTTGGNIGDPRDLSHLTFYNSEPVTGDDDDDDGGGPGEQIPEPNILALIGIGLVGIGATGLRRRQRKGVDA